MANQRARGHILPGPAKGSAGRNDNTQTEAAPVQKPLILSSEDSKYVGRPGYRGSVPGPVDGKDSVTRVMRDDPAVGRTQPGADVITDTHVDLVGAQGPVILSSSGVQPALGANRKTVRTPRQSAPVESNTPGRIVRPGR